MDDTDSDVSEHDSDISWPPTSPQSGWSIPSTSDLCASIVDPPQCWTFFGSPRDLWVVDIGDIGHYARDKFGFTVEEETFVITNAFFSLHGRTVRHPWFPWAPRIRQQVKRVRWLCRGPGCQLHMQNSDMNNLCNIITCRAVSHFVSLWIQTMQQRVLMRVLLIGWNAKLPPSITQHVHAFVEHAMRMRRQW